MEKPKQEAKMNKMQVNLSDSHSSAKGRMRDIKIEKVVLNVGGVGEKLGKGFILLQTISGKTPIKIRATKRIPTWNVRPGLEVGTKVTIRGKDAETILERLLPALENTLREKQIKDNFLSFGIAEYIEIPDLEYIREVGIMGFEVTVVFVRAGKRVGRKKMKKGSAKRQVVKREEIEKIMEDKFGTKILRKGVKNDGE